MLSMQNQTKNYISWLMKSVLSLLKDVQKQRVFLYRIVDWKKSECNEEDQLVIQVIGKNIFFSLPPSKIAQDDSLLSGFSQTDVKAIMTLNFISYSPKYRIKYMDFRDDLNEEIIGFQDRDDKSNIVRKKLSDFMEQMDFVDDLSAKDAFWVGRLVGNKEAS